MSDNNKLAKKSSTSELSTIWQGRLTLSSGSSTLPDIIKGIDSGEIRSITFLRKNGHEDEVKASIVLDITELNNFYGGTLSVATVKTIIELINLRYSHLTIDDIKLFSQRAMLGDFGKCYGSLTPAIVMQWLGEYSAQRFDEIENQNYIEHLNTKDVNVADNLDRYIKRITKKVE